jgi:hypothetical protein
VCAVESYYVTQLSNGKPDPKDYPADPIVMTSVQLEVDGYPVNPIKWDESGRKGGDYAAKTSMGGAENRLQACVIKSTHLTRRGLAY